jgi:hypothetical protein
MEDPWIIYLEELRDRGEEIPEQEFNRDADMKEAAHETYEATADRLHNQLNLPEPEALKLTKGFGRVVKEWIEEGVMDWDELAERLELFQQEWDPELGPSRV